jgi:hypothetical protein
MLLHAWQWSGLVLPSQQRSGQPLKLLGLESSCVGLFKKSIVRLKRWTFDCYVWYRLYRDPQNEGPDSQLFSQLQYKIVGQFYFPCGVGTVHKQLDENAIKRNPDF